MGAAARAASVDRASNACVLRPADTAYTGCLLSENFRELPAEGTAKEKHGHTCAANDRQTADRICPRLADQPRQAVPPRQHAAPADRPGGARLAGWTGKRQQDNSDN
eukprot:scaffold9592_cov118-Isochrysis_galbana.AAC.4